MYDISYVSDQSVREMMDTLRYLKMQFDTFGAIDRINMQHVQKALARVEIERSFARNPPTYTRAAEQAAHHLDIAAE